MSTVDTVLIIGGVACLILLPITVAAVIGIRKHRQEKGKLYISLPGAACCTAKKDYAKIFINMECTFVVVIMLNLIIILSYINCQFIVIFGSDNFTIDVIDDVNIEKTGFKNCSPGNVKCLHKVATVAFSGPIKIVI